MHVHSAKCTHMHLPAKNTPKHVRNNAPHRNSAQIEAWVQIVTILHVYTYKVGVGGWGIIHTILWSTYTCGDVHTCMLACAHVYTQTYTFFLCLSCPGWLGIQNKLITNLVTRHQHYHQNYCHHQHHDWEYFSDIYSYCCSILLCTKFRLYIWFPDGLCV